MWVAAVYSLTGFAKPSNLKDSYYFPKPDTASVHVLIFITFIFSD